ncbi:hypothetical protein PFISCL1PPCAC_17005, partial [Pristionchus fissidentatus]
LCVSSLKDWLANNQDKPRKLTQMKSWFNQMVEAVAYIHEAGIIHRDLKPGNIVLGNDYRLRICDFGVAIEYTEDGYVDNYAGTDLYASPEQFDWRLTPKTDVFSLGLVYVEMICRLTPEARISVRGI